MPLRAAVLLLLYLGCWLPKVTADNATDLGLTWVGQDALASSTATPPIVLPSTAVIHLPPALPSFNGGTRRIYRNDSTSILELRWSGLFDDGTDGLGGAAFVDGAGVRYWDWFYLGGTHPGGTPWVVKSLVVLPGDYVIEMQGGLSHVAASGWSIGVEPGTGRSDRLQVVRLHYRQNSGRSSQTAVIEARSPARGKRSSAIGGVAAPSGLESLVISEVPPCQITPTGGWLVHGFVNTDIAEPGIWEAARYELFSATESEGRLVVQLWVERAIEPIAYTDSVIPMHAESADPSELLLLDSLAARTVLEEGGLSSMLSLLTAEEILRFWQGLPNTVRYGALPRVLPPFTAVTLSGRPISRWELVSGPGELLGSAGAAMSLRVKDDSGEIVVRAVVDAGVDALGSRWSANEPNNGLLRIPVRRQVRVAAATSTKVYDGMPLAVEVRTSGALLAGDAWQVEPIVSGPDAGTRSVVPRARIVAADGSVLLDTQGGRLFDDRYRLEVVAGSAVITPRDAVVSAEESVRLYGEPNAAPAWRLSNAAPGETASFYATVHTAAEQSLPGYFAATTSLRVLKADGADSSANYRLTHLPAVVRVEPRPLTISVNAPPEREYDGQSASAQPFVLAGSVPAFDTLHLPAIAIPAEAGEHELHPSPSLRRIADGTDVAPAYALSVVSATARVLPAEVSGELGERWWDGAATLGDDDFHLAWRCRKTPGLQPLGSTAMAVTNAEGSRAVASGAELLPDSYLVEATFHPANGNFRPATAQGNWHVRAPMNLVGQAAEISRDGSVVASSGVVPTTHILPGTELRLAATPAADYAWGDTWEESSPIIWSAEPAGVLSAEQERSAAFTFTVPRQVRTVTLRASAFQLPPRVESLTIEGAGVTPGAGGTPPHAFLGRPGLVLRASGRCRESAVGAFEVQWKEPGIAEWPAAAPNAPWLSPESLATKAGEPASVSVGAQLGGVHADTPLVPLLAAEWAGREWTARCRVRSTSGRLSEWRELTVVGDLPLVSVPLRMRTLPPAGEEAAWFTESEESTVILPVWIP